MEKDRGFKVLAVVALLIAVAGVSIGFAAFSATLSVSGTATVSKDASGFTHTENGTDGVYLSNAQIDGTYAGNSSTASGTAADLSWTGLVAGLDEDNKKAVFTATVNNASNYNAYLNSIATSNSAMITCAATNAASDAVDATVLSNFCGKVTVDVEFAGPEATNTASRIITAGSVGTAITPSSSVYVDKNGTSGNGTATIKLTVTIASDAVFPDGAVTVTIPQIDFGFTSVAPSA